MLSHSTDCLTTTEMEEYEREVGEYSCLGSTDGSESEDGMEKELIKDESMRQEDEGSNSGEGENEDSTGEGEPGSGHSISGDEGSSADDDEDSKLRALLHQVGRPYAGYSSGVDAMGYNSRNREKGKQESLHNNRKSNDTAGNDSKKLGNLSQSNGNIKNGGLTIQEGSETGITATKSTFVGRDISGNGIIRSKEGGDENTKPRDVAEDYSEGYTLEDHIPGLGPLDGQWRIEPEVMRFLVH